MNKRESNCPMMKSIASLVDRLGTLHENGKSYSTGLFHLLNSHSGLYQWCILGSSAVPTKSPIVLVAQDGEEFKIKSIYRCPLGGHPS